MRPKKERFSELSFGIQVIGKPHALCYNMLQINLHKSETLSSPSYKETTRMV